MKTRAKPTLEGIPTELRILVLKYLPDTHTLHNIVRASPACHQAYVVARQEILHNLVSQSFGDVDIGEAVCAVRSEGLFASEKTNRERIIALLDVRRRPQEIRKIAGKRSRADPDGVDEYIKILHLDRKLNFILQDYSLNAPCPAWMDTDKWKLPLDLSRAEKARIIRAFYRMQTYSNIFGDRERTPPMSRSEGSRRWAGKSLKLEEVWMLFFATMPPWEVEEFGCVWAYVRSRYATFFLEIAPYVDELKRQHPQPPHPCLIVEEPGMRPFETYHSNYLRAMISLGPSVFNKILRQQSNEKRRDLIFYLLLLCINFDWDWSDQIYVGTYQLVSPADRLERGDFIDWLLSLPALEQPNEGWFWFWPPGTLESALNEDMFLEFGNFKGRAWGYALWDEDRLEEWGADDELEGERHFRIWSF
ncbi:hypothetical protein AJ80_00233 [Polytolypa hystricis UAMH7299]|uniref:F-box domain-containing protein n=1 Tax=Polytolypa hystricis (strain UAMH7299) TaxID=1447883 RepID=A0A2B7Z411_POLH7|nr:hypothetical protein AJ80_00233 [Polytolypa hystricis UAMH7299]